MPTWRNAPPPAGATEHGGGPQRGLVRRPASTPVFDVRRYPPGAGLEPWFEQLWTVDWDLGEADAHESSVISFPALHLTAEWGDPGELRHGLPLPATLLHGVVSSVFRVQLRGAGGVVGARFAPGGFRAWTGVQARPLRDRAVPALDLLGPGLGPLHEGLHALPPARRATAFADRLRGWQPRAAPEEDLADLLRRMATDPTLVRVEQVGELSGWSMRTLQRRFAAELGVPPKWVLARYRLQEAALALEQDPAVDLAALAVRLGWYDQAHLTNDFRRMLGETPAQYAARSR